jgi:hypothetical protein
MVRKEMYGETENMYGTRRQMVENRLDKGGKMSAATWFMRREISSTLNTAATPGGILRGRLQTLVEDMIAPDGGKTGVIETGDYPFMLD